MRTLLALLLVVLGLPAAAQQGLPPLTADNRADIARAEQHLNAIVTMKARFTQIGPRGEIAEGTFYLNRPGRLRFEYEPPAKTLVVADGLRLIYYDKELDHENQWPIAATPLAPLLAQRVDLGPGAVAVRKQAGVLRIALVDARRREDGVLTLVFSDNPLELRQWTVVDAQGLTTVIALSAVEINPQLEPDLFRPPERPNPER
ncbi:MAG: outer membrane lipoprotein carrier protein LolA [Alphaproteobacteria bacterium]|nr:outer membrane lipoprotein carrier protein LolA [Alphaproteobacteria bacterium]